MNGSAGRFVTLIASALLVGQLDVVAQDRGLTLRVNRLPPRTFDTPPLDSESQATDEQ